MSLCALFILALVAMFAMALLAQANGDVHINESELHNSKVHSENDERVAVPSPITTSSK